MNKPMEKKDLIAAIAEKSGLSHKDSQKALNAAIEVITESLTKGETVKITGFGTFAVHERAERKGRNPATGEEITIAATKAAAFKAGATLKEAVKG